MNRRAPIAAIGAIVLAIRLLPPVSAQQPRDVPRFKVGVDAVRIDAVVTDCDGRIVPDLSAADFELRQDGRRETVAFVQFVPVATGPDLVPEPAPRGPLAPSRAEIRPPPPLKREDVQRTFALVVDDLGLSVESLQNTQRALHAFVDRELRPADFVALVRTGGSVGALQSFTTDRRVLHAAIDGLRWNGASRNGVEPFEALNIFTTFSGGGPGGWRR